MGDLTVETACKRALIANISNHEALELNKLLQNAGFTRAENSICKKLELTY